jgi:glycosyltransferase involved in cell wall biosynthesis
LLIVGDGVDLARYTERESDTEGVRFAGFVQPAELPEWYGLCDVLAFPTHGDPNGLVVEEALAAGLPVIVSDAAGDIRARVPQSVGRVFPVGDVEALAEAMQALAEPSVREPMALRAPAWVAWKNDERYAEDLVRFAQDLTASPRRRTRQRAVCTTIGRLPAWWGRLRG